MLAFTKDLELLSTNCTSSVSFICHKMVKSCADTRGPKNSQYDTMYLIVIAVSGKRPDGDETETFTVKVSQMLTV